MPNPIRCCYENALLALPVIAAIFSRAVVFVCYAFVNGKKEARSSGLASENGRNVHLSLRVFKLYRKRVREWDKNYEVMLQQNFGKSEVRRKLSSGAPVFSEELDDTLYKFFRAKGTADVRNCGLLSEEALIAKKLQLGNFSVQPVSEEMEATVCSIYATGN
ncbi:hypothetical protein HPB48_003577 [Haemaphysalis longicornis]|uniref:Uncharacterized protein n=1 Tax=Haemaphysalis longicornis TaxID=44386 RepID=A0A9J6FP92_HAELO|nr:hypothetical protein HPB48_003577 [Haemaphysalis longicornis]